MSRPRKVNSRLKQLAETRARASANAERLTFTLNNLLPQIEIAKAALDNLAEQRFNLEHSLNQVHNQIRQTDKSIQEEFPGVEPSQIPSTYGFRSEYGKRGMLKETILDVLREAGERGLTLRELGLRVSKEFNMVHHTPQEFRRWVANSIEPALKRMRRVKPEVQNIRLAGAYPRWVFAPRREYSWNGLENLVGESTG